MNKIEKITDIERLEKEVSALKRELARVKHQKRLLQERLKNETNNNSFSGG